jgi:hypothetical protein
VVERVEREMGSWKVEEKKKKKREKEADGREV